MPVQTRPLRVLAVQPFFPESFWGFQRTMPMTGRRAAYPPLPLITVAALLPRRWEFQLVDLNVETLSDERISWADIVLTTGMIVQRSSLATLLERCERLGVPTVVGGPFASSSPDAPELARARSVVIGEAEDPAFLRDFVADVEGGHLERRYVVSGRPDLQGSPTPRYDLLSPGAYYTMSLQISRGCPFRCEFCDIWVRYGNRPRLKDRGQLEAELDAIHATGFRGSVFVVDDNFIGNLPRAEETSAWLGDWQARHKWPFSFFTEADIRLARSERTMNAMRDAGFDAVFVGFESPSRDALVETRKTQNLQAEDTAATARTLREHGLIVYGGYILGFDADGPEVFDAMVEMVEGSAVYFAMVGLLTALPGTRLEARLEREGRLLGASEGEQFQLTNFRTRLPRSQLIAGYRSVIERLYAPEAWFDRAFTSLHQWRPALNRRSDAGELLTGLRSLIHQGLRSGYRRAYWRFLARVAAEDATKLPDALAVAICGEHMLGYARDVLLPRLDHARREPVAPRQLAPPRPPAVAEQDRGASRQRSASSPPHDGAGSVSA